MEIIHIVRRYGQAGGMERYVWQLTHELARLGHRVVVVCERCDTEHSADIEVHRLGTMVYRPRWLYYWRFGRRVERWFARHPHPGWLVHSHERVSVHHVSTFHGPPFATVRDKPWWKKISVRIAMQLFMERRELRTAKAIVPNSEIIRQQLAHYYPEYAHKLTAPIVPGVQPGVLRPPRTAPVDGGVIGCVGYEWQRKGLPFAVKIVQELRLSRPNLELWVIGPNAEQVRHLFASWSGGYQLLGWRNHTDYLTELDVLLHPALAEPYGMVISEAMAAQVPVVISDKCGAATEVSNEAGAVLSLDAPLQDWTAAVGQQLNRSQSPPLFVHGWDAVAKAYVTIYTQTHKENT